MTPRRQQTAVTAAQPVRFYKFIALTFLVLTIVLLGLIVFMSSKRATITIETSSSPLNVKSSVTIGTDTGPGRIQGEVTSVIVSHEEIFQPTGTKEEPAVATGLVTLHNETDAAQALVATTRLLSGGDVLFRLKNRVTVPARGTIQAEVYADIPGAGGNIEAARFTIPGLREDKQKGIYATSDASMTGGVRTVGALSAEDIRKAEKRMMELLLDKGRQEIAREQGERGLVTTVIQQAISSDKEIGEEVSSFTLTGQATVAGVLYDEEALQRFAENELTKRAVDDTERIEGGRQEPAVSITEYDLPEKKATLEVLYSGTSYLNPESKQLEKSMFFGRTKDEVRRYVLKLDHVRGVEVKFSPAWIQTVPHIAEHVNIVVKNVE